MEAFDRLKQLVAAAEEDVIKVDKGNKAADQEVRVKVLEAKAQQPPQ